MNDHALCSWLMEKGNPVIRFRTCADLLGQTPPDSLLGELLDFPPVRLLLQKLEDYGPIERMDSQTLNRIHTGPGVEGYVAKLLEYGMRAGIAPFDARMDVFRQYVDNDFVKRAVSGAPGSDADAFRPVIIASLMSSYFARAGYRDLTAASDFIRLRIDSIYKIASQKRFDIYLTDEELAKYPKRPAAWLNRPVIRPEFDPYRNIMPLPIIHDIFGMAYFPRELRTPELDDKISAIITYIMDSRFRALPRGYGLVYYEGYRRYYACGWRPEITDPRGPEYERGIIVLYAELMSRFAAAAGSGWLKECLDVLEEYRTERGTYSLPPAMLKEKKDNGFVCGASMGLGENRRRREAYEIESTFRVLLIKKLLSETLGR